MLHQTTGLSKIAERPKEPQGWLTGPIIDVKRRERQRTPEAKIKSA